MNKKEAEDLVYKSYLKAKKHQNYNDSDSNKRTPELSRKMIREKAKTPCVVITGSKGKGSVANMISQILQSQYRVGLLTSPHMVDFCERFKMNGKDISDEDFVKYMSAIKPEIDAIEAEIAENVCISPIGIQVALGLQYFNCEKTDFNVFECGKGARYDDVNNVLHEYAVINSIFLEHTRELGETLEEIAADKSDVITGEQKCVYIAQQKPEVLEVIKKRAEETKVPLKVYGVDFKADNIRYSHRGMLFDVVVEGEVYRDISIPLLGEHQAKNCALAMALCKDVLETINVEAIRQKLNELEWPGRMEVISSFPFVMLDACINQESCEDIRLVIKYLNLSNITLVVGIPNDKDYAGVVKRMQDLTKSIILTRSQNPHYVFTSVQKETLAQQGIETLWIDELEEAIGKAKEIGNPIVILGTTAIVSDVKKLQLRGDL